MSAHQASVGGHLSSVAVSSSRASEADREEGEESESREPSMKRFSRAKLGKMCAEAIGTLSFLTATTTVAARGCNTASLHPVMSPLPRYQPPKPALRVMATDFQRRPDISRYRDEVGLVPVPLPVDGSDIPRCVEDLVLGRGLIAGVQTNYSPARAEGGRDVANEAGSGQSPW